MRTNKLQNQYKKHTKSTRTIRELKSKVNELEIEIKRLKLEFSWHEDRNNYAFGMIESSLNSIDDSSIPF